MLLCGGGVAAINHVLAPRANPNVDSALALPQDRLAMLDFSDYSDDDLQRVLDILGLGGAPEE